MQLRSIVLASFLTANLLAQDSVGVHYMYYDEDNARTIVKSPTISLHKEIGFDYDLDISFTHDTVSGASPTFYDAASGASASLPKGVIYPQDVVYGDINYEDHRKAFHFNLTKRFGQNRDEVSIGYSHSSENDYFSQEISLQLLHYIDSSKNSSLSYAISYQRNKSKIYCFLQEGLCDSVSGASGGSITKRAEVINLALGYTQILSKTSLCKLSVFGIFENGYLSNPYMRVVRNYTPFSAQITPENKPSTRNAIGITFELKKAFANYIADLNYRLYNDSWSILSNTIETSLTKEFAKSDLTATLRYYNQTAAFFYSSQKDYFTDEIYASSDRRMASYDSWNLSLCWSYRYNTQITFDIDGGYYIQPKYYHSIYTGIGVRYSF